MGDVTWIERAEQMATGLVLVDAGLRLQWVNPALAELLGVGPRRVVGQPLATLLAAAELAQAARALAEQQPLQLRGVALGTHADGSVAADVTLQPLDRSTLLLEVHPLAEPSAASSPLSASLRGLAHEVKNPLAGLRGAAQLLQRRVAEPELKALAGMVIAEADRLATLADRLLDRHASARTESVNIHEVLQRLSDLLQAEPAAPALIQDYDPSVPELAGDADRLQQVLLNLARNALDAGARTLTLRTRIAHGVRLGERTERTALRVDVGDDGAGVPAALRESLFEPLVSGRVDGTGLGLALAREIAHEHGGELRLQSLPGNTVFSLYLPLDRHDES